MPSIDIVTFDVFRNREQTLHITIDKTHVLLENSIAAVSDILQKVIVKIVSTRVIQLRAEIIWHEPQIKLSLRERSCFKCNLTIQN